MQNCVFYVCLAAPSVLFLTSCPRLSEHGETRARRRTKLRFLSEMQIKPLKVYLHEIQRNNSCNVTGLSKRIDFLLTCANVPATEVTLFLMLVLRQ